MSGGIDRSREVFKEEAYELLDELEAALLELENNPDDPEQVGRVFRAMHTLKGSGAMFGLYDIAVFTHEVETVYDTVRSGRLAVTKDLVDLTLKSLDHIRGMLKAMDGGAAPDKAKTDELVASFWRILTDAGVGTAAKAQPTQPTTTNDAVPDARGAATYRICFRPQPDILIDGTNPLGLLDELRGLGDCEVVARTGGVPCLEDMDPETCYTDWEVTLTTDRGIDAVKDVFIFVEDRSRLDIDLIDEISGPEGVAGNNSPAGPLAEGASHNLDQGAASSQGGGLSSAAGLPKPETSPESFDGSGQEGFAKRKAEATMSVRVASDKLDILSNLVGELVTAQARLTRKTATLRDPELQGITEEVERLTGELRDNTLGIRMVPIGATFTKFKRLVRDLSVELGKEVVMTTEGAETELDKTVIERLNDPIVHLIRNSIGHGIEPPEVRLAAGKPRHGTLHLSAVHSGANVLIRIRDDGAGLDAEAIRAKAVEKGLVAADAWPGEKELFKLIFTPGFSTANEVTNVSGRGVGLDVVKRCVESLRGTVEITGRKGAGATVTLTMPLTLAIIEGLLVQIEGEHFVLPLSAVEECVALARGGADASYDRRLMEVRGELVPYMSLREQFGIPGVPPGLEQVVVVREGGRRVGLVVDRVVGGHQTVVKSLGRVYSNVDGLSGATILGDGTVALMLDVPELVQSAEKLEAKEVVARMGNC